MYTENGIRTEMLLKQSALSKDINELLEEKKGKLKSISRCGNRCYRISFDAGIESEEDSADLEFDPEKREILFNNHTYKYPDGSELATPIVELKTTPGIGTGENNAILNIFVPVYHNLIDGDYGARMILQFDDREVEIPEIDDIEYIEVKITGKANGRKIESGELVNKDVILTAEPYPKDQNQLGMWTGYTYYWYEKVNGAWIQIQTGTKDGGAHKYRVKAKEKEGRRQFKVRVYAKSDKSAESIEFETNIDTTPPTCITKVVKKTDGINGIEITDWTNQDVKMIGTCSDASGCVNATVETSKSVREGEGFVGSVSPGKVIDRAGNETLCPSKQVKIDKIKPTCAVYKKSGTIGENGWYRSNVKVAFSSGTKDNGIASYQSGIETYEMSTVQSSGYQEKQETEQGDTRLTTWYGRVRDKAGNVSEICQTSMSVDTKAPSCELKVTNGTKGENNWYKSSPTLSLSYNDNTGGSGVKENYGLTPTSTVSYNQGTTTKITDTTGKTYYGHVKDEAGNETTCASHTVKIDRTPPDAPKPNEWSLVTISKVGYVYHLDAKWIELGYRPDTDLAEYNDNGSPFKLVHKFCSAKKLVIYRQDAAGNKSPDVTFNLSENDMNDNYIVNKDICLEWN